MALDQVPALHVAHRMAHIAAIGVGAQADLEKSDKGSIGRFGDKDYGGQRADGLSGERGSQFFGVVLGGVFGPQGVEQARQKLDVGRASGPDGEFGHGSHFNRFRGAGTMEWSEATCFCGFLLEYSEVTSRHCRLDDYCDAGQRPTLSTKPKGWVPGKSTARFSTYEEIYLCIRNRSNRADCIFYRAYRFRAASGGCGASSCAAGRAGNLLQLEQQPAQFLPGVYARRGATGEPAQQFALHIQPNLGIRCAQRVGGPRLPRGFSGQLLRAGNSEFSGISSDRRELQYLLLVG